MLQTGFKISTQGTGNGSEWMRLYEQSGYFSLLAGHLMWSADVFSLHLFKIRVRETIERNNWSRTTSNKRLGGKLAFPRSSSAHFKSQLCFQVCPNLLILNLLFTAPSTGTKPRMWPSRYLLASSVDECLGHVFRSLCLFFCLLFFTVFIDSSTLECHCVTALFIKVKWYFYVTWVYN